MTSLSSEAGFDRVAVLGLGLLGGSVAAGARARGAAREVVGYARRRGPLERALKRGFVDRIFDAEDGVAAAVEGADLVILATPVSTMAPLLEQASPALRPGALVTDVGSVKGPLADTIPGLLPDGVAFIGSHPMAGSHETGVDFARPDLLEGSCCVVSSGADSNGRSNTAQVDRLVAFWSALGARVVHREPEAHDVDVAWVSHLPHVVAFAYARALSAAPGTAIELAGSGFRDFVRIARSDSELWGDILGLNHKALAGPLKAFSEALGELARAIEAGGPPGIAERERLLDSATRSLDELAPPEPHRSPELASPGKPAQTPAPSNRESDDSASFSARSGGANPEIQAARKSGSGHQE